MRSRPSQRPSMPVAHRMRQSIASRTRVLPPVEPFGSTERGRGGDRRAAARLWYPGEDRTHRESAVDRARADRFRAGARTLPADEPRAFCGTRPERHSRPRLEARPRIVRRRRSRPGRRPNRRRYPSARRTRRTGAGRSRIARSGPFVEAGPDDLPAVVDVLPGADRPAGAVHHERVEVEERRDRLRDAAEVDDDGDLPVLRRVRRIADGLAEAVEPEELGHGVARQRCDRSRRGTRPDSAERAAVGRAVADDEPVGPDRVGDAGGRRSRGRRDLPEVLDASVRPARCMNGAVCRIRLADDHARRR